MDRKEIIGNIMREAGILPTNRGYFCLIEVISCCCDSNCMMSMSREIFPEIEKKMGIKPSSAHQQITRAIDEAVRKNKEKIERIMYGEKYITPKRFVYAVVDRVRTEERKNGVK